MSHEWTRINTNTTACLDAVAATERNCFRASEMNLSEQRQADCFPSCPFVSICGFLVPPFLFSVVCALSLSLSAFAKDIEEKQTIQKTLVFDDSAGARQIEVDNFEGSIQVMGYDGRDVQLVVHETLEADSR